MQIYEENLGQVQVAIDRSKQEGKSDILLRGLVFSIIHEALCQQYGENYSDKCLQSSVGIRALLKSFGIKTEIFGGAVCLPILGKGESTEIGWQGFWGESHHIWTITEFGELVDLTITQLNLHPISKGSLDRCDPPALWWDDIVSWPSFIHYLPNAPIDIQLPDDEMDDLLRFEKRVLELKEETLKKEGMGTMAVPRVISGPATLERLYQSGDEWAEKCLVFQDLEFELPAWIQIRHKELVNRRSR